MVFLVKVSGVIRVMANQLFKPIGDVEVKH